MSALFSEKEEHFYYLSENFRVYQCDWLPSNWLENCHTKGQHVSLHHYRVFRRNLDRLARELVYQHHIEAASNTKVVKFRECLTQVHLQNTIQFFRIHLISTTGAKLGAQLFTSMIADLRQVINGGFEFSRCLNVTFS